MVTSSYCSFFSPTRYVIPYPYLRKFECAFCLAAQSCQDSGLLDAFESLWRDGARQ